MLQLIFYFMLLWIAFDIINIKRCQNEKVSEYKPWSVQDTLWAGDTLQTFVKPLYVTVVILSYFLKGTWGEKNGG